MGLCSTKLLREFDSQWVHLQLADEIVLYGKTDVLPVIETALETLGSTSSFRVFDSGSFADGGVVVSDRHRVILLCGMRAKTRDSMRQDAAVYFPKAPSFDFLAVYYAWLVYCVKRDCSLEELAETLLEVRADRTIHNIDSINTTFCTLNCKECSNGIQYRRNKKHISLERQIRSLNALTELLPISYCNLQGGEPLLDQRLTECLNAHAHNARIAFLSLATNGTIVPSNEVMQALRDSGTMLRISDYGSLSGKKAELLQKAACFSVPCDTYRRAESWLSYGELRPHGRTEVDNRAIMQNCHFGTKDLMLYDGRLYCCCRTLFADACGAEIDAAYRNVIDLFRPFTRYDLDGIISGRELSRMCDYCDYPMMSVSPAEQVTQIE